MPAALAARGAEIGDGFTERMLVTVGEACLKPAILLAIGGPGHDELRKATSPRVMDAPARTMLTPGINSAFRKNLERQHNSGAQRIATGGEPQGKWDGQSVLFEVDGARMLEDPLLSEEVFRPTALLVRVKDVEQLIAIARQFRGQLSATMQIDPGRPRACCAAGAYSRTSYGAHRYQCVLASARGCRTHRFMADRSPQPPTVASLQSA